MNPPPFASAISPPRDARPARAAYAPSWPPETFIVPRLAGAIGTALDSALTELPAAARVLDVGCGRQPFRAAITARGLRYYGLDAVQNPEGNVDFIGTLDGPLPAAALAEGPYDFLLCTEVLEHVADWPAAFRNLARLAAPGAKVLITCPHFYPLHEVPYDFWRPTPFALRHHAAASGFAVERLEQLGDNWDVLGTFLAEAWPYARTPRLADRILARIVRSLLRGAFRQLARGAIQRRVELRGLHYLANLAVLVRQSH